MKELGNLLVTTWTLELHASGDQIEAECAMFYCLVIRFLPSDLLHFEEKNMNDNCETKWRRFEAVGAYPPFEKKNKNKEQQQKSKKYWKNIKTKRVWIQEYYEGERIAAVNVVVGPLTAS